MAAQTKKQQLHRTAVVFSPDQETFDSHVSSVDRVEVLETGSGCLVLRTQNEAQRFLVISEVWHPGWRASLDGRQLQLHRTDLALMGALIPPGKHELTLQFRPQYWSAAVGISAVSSVVFLVLFGIFCRRRWLSDRSYSP